MEDPVSYYDSFIAGFDPTGTKTFDIAQRAQRHTGHTISGLVGGALGGATIVPAVVGAASKVITRRAGIKAAQGVGGKLDAVVRALGAGAVSPFKELYDVERVNRSLGRVAKTGDRLHKPHVDALVGLINGAYGKGGAGDDALRLIHELNDSATPALRSEAASTVRSVLGKQRRDLLIALGSSAALGSGSSALQYSQGVDVGNKMRALQQGKGPTNA